MDLDLFWRLNRDHTQLGAWEDSNYLWVYNVDWVHNLINIEVDFLAGFYSDDIDLGGNADCSALAVDNRESMVLL